MQLAPLYDVISFLPYTQGDLLDLRVAMSFGDDHSVGAMAAPDAWRTAGRMLGIDPDMVADRAADLLRRTPSAMNDAVDALSAEDRSSRAVLPLLRSAQRLADQVLGQTPPSG